MSRRMMLTARVAPPIKVVAVGDAGEIHSSADGITWTTQAVGSASWQSVDWSPSLGLFVVVANSGTTFATSPDGVTWTTRTGGPKGSTIRWAPYLGKFFCLYSTSVMYTSTDGLSWTSNTPTDDPVTASPQSICWDEYNKKFFGWSVTYGRTVYSTDGIAWYRATDLDYFTALQGTATNPSGISMVVGQSTYWSPYASRWRSTTGAATWTEISGGGGSSFNAICWSNDGNCFILWDDGGYVYKSSSDGTTLPTNIYYSGFNYVQTAAAPPGLGVIAGMGNGGVYSTTASDGQSGWAKRVTSSNQTRCIAFR